MINFPKMKLVWMFASAFVVSTSLSHAVSTCVGYTKNGNTYPCPEHGSIISGVFVGNGDFGNCTWWAASQLPATNFEGGDRDAFRWLGFASEAHLPIGHQPVAGSVVVFENASSDGHVAYITEVNDDDSFDVTEMSYNVFHGMRTATYTEQSLGGADGYIYPSTCRDFSFAFIDGVFCWGTDDASRVRNDNYPSCLDGNYHRLYYVDEDASPAELKMIRYLPDSEEKRLICQDYLGSEVDFGDWYSHPDRGIRYEMSDGYGGFFGEATFPDSPAISGTSPQPIPGPRPDHLADFDVFDQFGVEVSADCDNCPTQNVYPGQLLTMRLETQTRNRDVVTSDLHDEDSQSIDGRIICRVENVTSWQEIPNSEDVLEYDVDNLVEDENSSLEEIEFTVPNNPGSILACQAFVDDDNEVKEESESNNTSREERFLITHLVNLTSSQLNLSDNRPKPDESFTMSFTFQNTGTGTIESTTTAEITIDGNEIDSMSFGQMQKNETRTLQTSLSLPKGRYTIQACADSSNTLSEIDESDNCMQNQLRVTKIPPYEKVKPLIDHMIEQYHRNHP
jgi:surface antigen